MADAENADAAVADAIRGKTDREGMRRLLGGVASRTLDQYLREGMPHTRAGKAMIFDPPECLAWFRERTRRRRAALAAKCGPAEPPPPRQPGRPRLVSKGPAPPARVRARARSATEEKRLCAPHKEAAGSTKPSRWP